jgi:hypothetical protein
MQTGLSKKLHLLCPPSPLLFILSKGAGFEVILVKVRLYIYISNHGLVISIIACYFLSVKRAIVQRYIHG